VNSQLKKPVRTNPATVIAISFLGAIFLGTVLLKLPIATSDGIGLELIDALFTAASAVCVTGLTVLDTGTRFSEFGQGVILLLIQVGGLGIMTFSTLFTILLGKKLSLRNRLVIGAVFLFWGWRSVIGNKQAFYAAVFHSVSAFCNAGFSLFSENMIPYRTNYMILFSITVLIILGGIGFVVLLDLERYFFHRKSKSVNKISYHSKIVLLVTSVLLFSGMIIVLVLEWDNTFRSLGLPEKLINAFLESATCRTAGFNSVPTGLLHPSTLAFFMFLMFVGASPGSTGGGIKTTTFAIILSTIKSMAYGESEVTLFRRAIPRKSIRRAISISGFAFIIIFFFALMLMMIETKNPAIPEKSYFLSILFEVVSAFGTVGLSTGVTPQLTETGKFFIILVMFIGRIGPLTLALAIGNRKMPPTMRYSEAQITVG
jgi:trk system potassium uptake protein TrkH